MSTIVVYNPACGDQTAKSFFEQEVIPFLERNGKSIDRIIATEKAGHAGTAILEYLESVGGDVTVVLGSGDGTLHEIISLLSSSELRGVRAESPPLQLHFALVPCGTANALYSTLFPPPDGVSDTAYRLKSLQSFIESKEAKPLSLNITTLSSPPAQRKRPEVAISAVVTSTSLHASILHDSEALRATIPSMERFKVAAKQNSSKWYNATAKLLPASPSNTVEIYDPDTKTFVPHPEAEQDDPIVDLYGPFVYFLSTVNVDRLEPAFRITPLAKDIRPAGPSCEVVIIRPERDPTFSVDSPEAREAFVPKLWAALGGAYKNGSHIGLRYNDAGDIVSEGDGPTVVEYIRCGGWEWSPDYIDDSAHLLCADGTIFDIEKDGRAVCRAALPDKTAGFMVYA